MNDKEAMAMAQEKALQALHDENERLGLYKDAYAQPEQEPVAWGVFEGNLHDMFFTQEEAQEMASLKGSHAEVRPLYTISPQRTEPPAWFPAVENILNEYGLQAIDFVADFKEAMKDAEQSHRTERNFCARCGKRTKDLTHIHTCTPPPREGT
jgi:hypothetical protein